MIRSYSDYQLQKHHTFGTKATAKYYFEFTEKEDLEGFISTTEKWKNLPILILGEGSNLLFVNNFEGLIINPNLPGIKIAHEDRNNIWLEVGAAAVQNIGAYGMEIQYRIESVTGFGLESQTEYTLDAADCQYAYRDSIFKNQLKDRFIITSVSLKLDKFPEFILNYGDLKSETEKLGAVNLRNIRQAVIGIRESKLPDPKVFGNAGSFFKNPIIKTSFAEQLLATYPNMPHYPAPEGETKLAAGWLIEQCGWKGFRREDAGVHEKQALVLINYGNATGKEIYHLSEEIKQSVQEKFGVELEREVNVID